MVIVGDDGGGHDGVGTPWSGGGIGLCYDGVKKGISTTCTASANVASHTTSFEVLLRRVVVGFGGCWSGCWSVWEGRERGYVDIRVLRIGCIREFPSR